MMKRFFLGLLVSLWSQVAAAGVSCTVPFTFVPGTLADANQVNANYAALVACLLNAAGAGNNNDITALLALTTPITPAAGGSTMFVGGTSTGTANAQVVASPSPIGFALTRGLSILFTAGFTNTGATTLAVNGTAATNVFRQSPSGPQAMTGGEIVSGDLVWAVYDGTQFQLINSGAQTGGFGPLTTLASASPDLGTIPSHNIAFIENAGSPITSFGSTASTTFPLYRITFSTSLVLTYNASSMILPNAQNITTATGDTAVAQYLGSGNWQVISYSRANGTSVVSPTPLCGFSGLVGFNGASDSTATWSWQSSNLLTSSNVPVFSGSKSGITINITTVGAGGMDTAGLGANTFVYMYAIYNGSVWNAVGSTNPPSTGPSPMPTGYTYSCYMGAMKVNAATHLYGTRILGNEARYVNGGANLTSLPVIVSGPTGMNCASSGPVYAGHVVSGNTGAAPLWVPSTAVAIDVLPNSMFTTADTAQVYVAPNANYGSYIVSNNETNPPPVAVLSTTPNIVTGRLLLESTSIYICISAASGAVHAYGWKDAVNAN